MLDPCIEQITSGNIHQVEPGSLLSNPQALALQVNTGLKEFMARTVNEFPGNIPLEAARALVSEIAHYEIDRPLYSVHPFRYVPVPELPEAGYERTAESTVTSALENARYMRERFGDVTFASQGPNQRRLREVTWFAPVDRDYHLNIRGGSGAGTFSIDFGLGVIDYNKKVPKYKELWRTGIDTAISGDALAARFIRTGTAIKEGRESFKGQSFDRFYKQHGILPQRLLGLVGLYFMRELEPDHAFALTTEGARRFSSLKHSKGGCDYTKIFGSLGFQAIGDKNWLAITDFENGFYAALEASDNRKAAEDTLNLALESLKTMITVDPLQKGLGPLFEICSDDSPNVISRELKVVQTRRERRRVTRRKHDRH